MPLQLKQYCDKNTSKCLYKSKLTTDDILRKRFASTLLTRFNYLKALINNRKLPQTFLHCDSKNDTDVAHYNFDADQPILVVFDRDVAERVCYQMVICYPTFPN